MYNNIAVEEVNTVGNCKHLYHEIHASESMEVGAGKKATVILVQRR